MKDEVCTWVWISSQYILFLLDFIYLKSYLRHPQNFVSQLLEFIEDG